MSERRKVWAAAAAIVTGLLLGWLSWPGPSAPKPSPLLDAVAREYRDVKETQQAIKEVRDVVTGRRLRDWWGRNHE